jgi:glucosamine-6-phosphate deaminase
MKDSIKEQEIEVRIFDHRMSMGADAAKEVGGKISALLAKKDFVNIIFAAAPSQNEFLTGLSRNRQIDWSRVNAFHMDEYIGLADDVPQKFGNFLKEGLFSKVPFHSVHYMDGNPANIKEECNRYVRLLREYPPDIACMGIGENGHIAFNDPPVADFDDERLMKEVELDTMCRQQQVNDGCFSALQEVPAAALTLTIPALMSAGFIYCIVPGKTKAQAVFNTLHQDIDPLYPSTILRKHPHVILFLDKQSSELL